MGNSFLKKITGAHPLGELTRLYLCTVHIGGRPVTHDTAMEGYDFNAMDDRDGLRFSWHLLYVWLSVIPMFSQSPFHLRLPEYPPKMPTFTGIQSQNLRPKTKIGATRAVVPIAAMYVHICCCVGCFQKGIRENSVYGEVLGSIFV